MKKDNLDQDQEKTTPKSVEKHGLMAIIFLVITIILIICGIVFFIR